MCIRDSTGPANIGTWNVSSVTNMTSMFYEATAFNQDISTWNVSSVTTMRNMFERATAFNQSLGKWTLNASVGLDYMLYKCGMNCENYSKTLVGWANNPATVSCTHLAQEHLLRQR